MQTPTFDTLVSILRHRAEALGDRPVYTLSSGGQVTDRLSFSSLRADANAIAAQLALCTAPGDRVLILCPPGLDYIRAFFGCLVSGRVAVPAYPPRHPRYLARLESILDDSLARCVLTTTPMRDAIRSPGGALARIPIVWVDDVPPLLDDWEPYAPGASDLAFLQYTSGSTGAPKGVMVTHQNLIAHAAMMQRAFQLSADEPYVSWLPLFHDMGLMAMLHAVYAGAHEIILSPLELVSRPFRWLEAITTHRATVSGGPNFAYDLCASRISEAEREQLDLSSWRIAFNGSEPVQAETLERFTLRFAGRGFRHAAHYPCYGLAEATLFVSGAGRPRDPVCKSLSRTALADGEVRGDTSADAKRLIGCGQAFGGELVRIVHPDERRMLPDGSLGEIWVSSDAVAAGYWRNAPATAETFHATLAGAHQGRRYLRTGDLGFVDSGELYVAGRLKDLIIIRGQNYYPQDIEITAQHSHLALVAGGGAAFEHDGGAVLVQELRRTGQGEGPAPAAVIAAIKQAVAETLGLDLTQVVLVQMHSIPRTSSGKIQRRQTHQLFLDGALKRIPGADAPAPAAGLSRTAIEGALRSIAARVLQRPFILIDLDAPLASLGLDDVSAQSLRERIREELGADFSRAQLASSSLRTLVDGLASDAPGARVMTA
jgi:acyl-CoA synthetase (AMP-forming)/AMP-acid ligase II